MGRVLCDKVLPELRKSHQFLIAVIGTFKLEIQSTVFSKVQQVMTKYKGYNW